jgi:hypothetical protein
LCLTGPVAVAIQANSRLTAHREATAATRTLPELKRELTELLRQLRQPLLVVIDDIDRLTPDEMKAVFQLVRANADLPNLVYLLLFPREPVERALSGVVGESQRCRPFLRSATHWLGLPTPANSSASGAANGWRGDQTDRSRADPVGRGAGGGRAGH